MNIVNKVSLRSYMDCVDKLTVQCNRQVGHVLLPQGHNGNTSGRGTLDDVTK